MLISEVFDSSVKWEHTPPDDEEDVDNEYTAIFMVGDNQYQFYAYNDGEGGRHWEIEFRMDREGYIPMSQKYGVTGSGKASTVFSTIIKLIHTLVKERDVDSFRFSAKEPSRVKLYDAMSKKLKPAGWNLKTKMVRGEKVYEFSKG